ncbi:MAG: LTA synthase family protein [Lentisphaeria bacterium]|nr:LTA synthase family protein [Lentisphaeria bacterium]
MKAKIFLRRSLSILLMLVLTLISSTLAAVMYIFCASFNGQGLYPVCLLFGDALIPLALFIPALLFRNRFLSLAALLCSFFNIFIRLSSIIIFKETFMTLDYESVKMLLIHSDRYAIEAFLGSDFYYWAVPLAVAGVAMIVGCGVIVWRNSGRKSGRVVKKWLLIFSLLFSLSLISNLLFQALRPHDIENYTIFSPLPFVSAELANDTLKELYDKKIFKPVPLTEKSREILKEEKIIADSESETPFSGIAFEKIIIIAVESLDYDFIGMNNPDMPQGITPNLDRFSRENISFGNYYTASLPTSWALNSMLLSRLDYEKDRFIQLPSFFTEAGKNGFFTWYFSAASGLFGNNRQIYDHLFNADKLYFFEEWNEFCGLERSSDWGLSDEMLFDAVYDVIKKSGKKRFAAVISTMDTHPPYNIPETKDSLPDEGGKKEKFSVKFLKALHNTDRSIGKFVDKLTKDAELFDEKSLIIITADHTATHGENYLKRSNFLPERIPLIFITGNKTALNGINPDKFASSIDLAPTLVRFVGGTIPRSFMGRDLYSDKDVAFCRTYGDLLLLYSKSGLQQYHCHQETTDEKARAFIDFYFSHYGK